MKMRSARRAIDKIYKRRDRYEIPEWQRQEVWSRSKKQNLIDSILKGWKLPKFYFLRASEDPEAYEVVDGQQRLSAILEFFENALPLADKPAKDFGGTWYRDLPDMVVDAFDDYEIEYDEITDATEDDIKEFFQRLQEGLPLTSAEKLNSIPSRLRDYVMKLTKHSFFSRVRASDRRYGHFDIVAKAAAIEVDGMDVGLRYDDLRAVFESQSEFASSSNVATRLDAALGFLDKGITDEQAQLLRNRTIVQSLLTLACQVVQSGRGAGHEQRLAEFYSTFLVELKRQVELGQQATDADYLEFQRTVNANVKTGARTRHQILLRKLLATDPAFVELFDPTAIAESGIRAGIASDAAHLVTRIGVLNEEYAAQHGRDLFKATNRTTQAQVNLGKPLSNFDDYKSFIDDLYFLFWESVGDRLDGRIPASFRDVNTLRTDRQHDVDHGKKGKVKSKKQQLGQTFGKYAGAPSPAGLAPERFVVVQANILLALRADLDKVKA